MQQLTPKQGIESITYQQDHLNILFAQNWYQEDITELSKLVFLPVEPVIIKEQNFGADREDIRFNWNENYFVLNFDFYSQSCWIEGQDSAATECLNLLYTAINKRS
ncbi:DUF3630 family protein [Colwellia echini]|uniref:DUF3630 family protein n=1 Tax=Colwellia echini TaxID=1982103 RepID=A0ABY3MZF7_9GAMM|nr:DUF3630 family protein [Colwellia echini]TYK66521.1 DUF3630 family protein [Colwellia echini]